LLLEHLCANDAAPGRARCCASRRNGLSVVPGVRLVQPSGGPAQGVPVAACVDGPATTPPIAAGPGSGSGVLVPPVQHGVGAVVAGQVVVQALEPRMNRAGAVAQKLIQASQQGAAGAPAGQVLGAGAASWAACQKDGVRPGAGRAERAGERPACHPAADQPDVAADGAACPPFLAGAAPRLAGDLGDLGGSQPRRSQALTRPSERSANTSVPWSQRVVGGG
jgi:hypothetical protein